LPLGLQYLPERRFSAAQKHPVERMGCFVTT
jgi:hypothetical protein